MPLEFVPSPIFPLSHTCEADQGLRFHLEMNGGDLDPLSLSSLLSHQLIRRLNNFSLITHLAINVRVTFPLWLRHTYLGINYAHFPR
jgi:hypothetical protein